MMIHLMSFTLEYFCRSFVEKEIKHFSASVVFKDAIRLFSLLLRQFSFPMKKLGLWHLFIHFLHSCPPASAVRTFEQSTY